MLGLYVHIPFCKKKCRYCAFFSHDYESALADRYLCALKKHASLYKKQKLDTVYIGGGTPSVLSPGQISELLSLVNENFDLEELKEFTFEMNPESVTEEKLRILKASGVNRISIGLQSADDGFLKTLGRVHDYAAFKKAYELAGEAGFESFNVDLIYGLPGQTLEQWKNDLRTVIGLKSGHLSLYPLSVEEDTEFYGSGIKTDDDMQRTMYETAVELLSANGFEHYEISNWAKPGKEALHNSNYWRNFEYIGLGAGASGYFNRFRYSNMEDTGQYIENVLKGVSAESETDLINEELYEIEKIMLALRLLKEGAEADCFKNKRNKGVLEKLLAQGLLVKDNERIKLSKEYVFVSNSVLAEFMK